MWQRIQTLWLLLACIAMAIFAGQDLLVLSVSSSNGLSEAITLSPWRVVDLSGSVVREGWALGAVAILSALLSSVSIFLYKHRSLQRRLTILNLLLIINLMLYLGFVAWDLHSSMPQGVELGIRFALSLPLVSLILLYLALRGIIHDEVLLRMADRLR